MHHHPNPDDALAQAILGLLIDDHPGLWSLAELTRAVEPDAPQRTAEAVAVLHGAGLVNRVGDCVFASRAAHTVAG